MTNNFLPLNSVLIIISLTTNHPAESLPTDPDWAGRTVLRDVRVVDAPVPADDLFWAFARVGGDVGYYTMDWAWHLRGVADRLLGGVGLRRGRRHPTSIRVGDAIDFWRVAEVEPGRRLLLRAEMLVPGEAFLEWSIDPEERELRQTATFFPRGLWGRVYWWVLVPAHALIFGRMARRVVATAAGRAAGKPPVTVL